MVQNKSLVLARYVPSGFPIPGQDLKITSSEFDLTTPPPEGGLIVKTNYVSYDPALRGYMRSPAGTGYAPGFQLNKPLLNNGIHTVISSSNPRFKTGDVVISLADFSEYQVIGKELADKEYSPWLLGGVGLLKNSLDIDPKLFLGALGMSGLTAYSSFYEIGNPKKGDVIFVSAASGGVGAIVGQLAKREGLKVIGSVGSDEKLKFIEEELGFDAGFNYKKEKPLEALQRILKELDEQSVAIYYDNVGGEQLEAAIAVLGNFGRIIACGSISQGSLQAGEEYGIKNMPLVVGKRITIRGFIVYDPDMGPKYSEEHQSNLQKWIKNGEITIKIDLTDGIDNAAEGLVGIFKGENFGKAVLKIADI